jgi:hypothetical protein
MQGIKHADGIILVFMDADMYAPSNYLKMLTAPILTGKAKGTVHETELVGNAGLYLADCWAVAGGCPVGIRMSPDSDETPIAFRAIQKELVESVIKLPEHAKGAVGEDILLGKHLGFTPYRAKGAVCYHNNPSKLSEYTSAATWYGKGWAAQKSPKAILKLVVGFIPPLSMIKRTINSQRGWHSLSWVNKLYYTPGLILYDLAVLKGIISYLFTGKTTK